MWGGVMSTRRRHRAGASPQGHAPRRPQAPSAHKKPRGSHPAVEGAGCTALPPAPALSQLRLCHQPRRDTWKHCRGPPSSSQPQARQLGGHRHYFPPPGPQAITGEPPERHKFGFRAHLEQAGDQTLASPPFSYPNRCQTSQPPLPAATSRGP